MSRYYSYTSNPFSNHEMGGNNKNNNTGYGGFFTKNNNTSQTQNSFYKSGSQMYNNQISFMNKNNPGFSMGSYNMSTMNKQNSTFDIHFETNKEETKNYGLCFHTSIMHSNELKNSNYSLLYMRCKDYVKIKMNENNCQQKLSNEISNGLNNNHLNQNLFNPNHQPNAKQNNMNTGFLNSNKTSFMSQGLNKNNFSYSNNNNTNTSFSSVKITAKTSI